MSPRGRRQARRKRNALIGGAAGLIGAIAAIVAIYSTGGQEDLIPPVPPGAAELRLDLGSSLDAAVATGFYRDLGALPSRDTWCSGSAHCWVFQQSSGDATDYGDTGGWHLSPVGSPRAGVVTSLPVRDASGWVDLTSELAIHTDDATTNAYQKSSVTSPDASEFSATVIFSTRNTGAYQVLYIHYSGAKGHYFAIDTAGKLTYILRGGAIKTGTTTSVYADSAWHCATLSSDGTGSGLYLWVDGVAAISAADGATGNMAVTQKPTVARHDTALYPLAGGIARVKVGYTATSYAGHVAACGDLWQAPAGGPNNNKPLSADATWTQTGGARCYPSSSTTAVCTPGGMVPYTVDATGLGIPTEPDATNRIAFSTAIDSTNWTAGGTATATPLQTAPDGSATASLLTVGTTPDYIYATATGYGNGATLYPRFWVKCSSGTLRVQQTLESGTWDIACATASAGAWTLIYSAAQTGVTEGAAWQARVSDGAARWMFLAASGTVSAYVWAPTLTEEPGTGLSVIPTGASAVSTGDISWSIANGLANTGSQLMADYDCEDATTLQWSKATNTVLSKESGSPGGSGSQVLRVAYGGTTFPYAYQAVVESGKVYCVTGWARGDGTAPPRVRIGGDFTWIGTSSTSWQAVSGCSLSASTWVQLYQYSVGAGWTEFDEIAIYEQRPHGRYYHAGDTQYLADGDCEAPDLTAWSTTAGVTTKSAASPYNGFRAIRSTETGGLGVTGFYQAILTAAVDYRVRGYYRTDGASAAYIARTGGLIWTGAATSTWTSFSATFTADGANLTFGGSAGMPASGWVEFDEIMVHRADADDAGDTISKFVRQITGTCWDTTSSTTGALLLSGASGSECSGVWYDLQVSP